MNHKFQKGEVLIQDDFVRQIEGGFEKLC